MKCVNDVDEVTLMMLLMAGRKLQLLQEDDK